MGFGDCYSHQNSPSKDTGAELLPRGELSLPSPAYLPRSRVLTWGVLMGVAVTEAHGQDRWAAAAVIMEQSCSQKQLQFWV